MFGWNVAEAPRRELGGLVSRVLLQKGDLPGVGLTAMWVDVAPGARQRLHEHDAEQIYVVLEGRGRMRVGDEDLEVERGDLVYIPPGAAHGIENASGGPLVCVSAATPTMDALAVYDTGQLLRPREDGEG